MDLSKWLRDGRKRYLTIRNSVNDCSNASSSNLTKAIEAYNAMEKELKKFHCQEDGMYQISLITALLNYEMGIIYRKLKDTDKVKYHFLKSVELIEDKAMEPKCIILTINIISELSIMWANINEHERAWDCFQRAYEYYEQYKESRNPPPVISLEDLFLPITKWETKSGEGYKNLYLLQTSALKTAKSHFGSAKFTDFLLLKLKVLLNKQDTNPLLWSVYCEALVFHFLDEHNFQYARYILACVNKAIADYEECLKVNKKSVDQLSLSSVKTFVSFVTFNYVVCILRESSIKAANLQERWDNFRTVLNLKNTDASAMLELFKEDEIKEFENEITCSFASNYKEAMKLFQFGEKHLKLYKNSDTKSDNFEVNIGIIRDHSNLYLALSKFVDDPDVECKMHKRRADLLESALPKVDITEYPVLYLGIMFDLGVAYFMMLNIKRSALNSGKEASKRNIDKINSLGNKIIPLYESYINGYKDETGKLPEKLPEDIVGWLMLMHNCLSKTYTQIISTQEGTIENTKVARNYCKTVIDYIAKNPDQQKLIEVDVPLSAVIQRYDYLTEEIKNLESLKARHVP